MKKMSIERKVIIIDLFLCFFFLSLTILVDETFKYLIMVSVLVLFMHLTALACFYR